MYIFRYFHGEDLEWDSQWHLADLIRIAKKNPNIYQIIRNNKIRDVVWERWERNASDVPGQMPG